jgi:hypothetical protein
VRECYHLMCRTVWPCNSDIVYLYIECRRRRRESSQGSASQQGSVLKSASAGTVWSVRDVPATGSTADDAGGMYEWNFGRLHKLEGRGPLTRPS